MTVAVRMAGAAWALSLILVSAGCAAKFSPSTFKPEARKTIPTETSFELITDGHGGCKRTNGPFAVIGSSQGTVSWKVTNRCGMNATVFIDDFNLKHRLGKGPFPFEKALPGTPVANDAEVTITATVVHTNTVGSDFKGFNVYRYRVRVQAGGHETKQDPEIIIEWP